MNIRYSDLPDGAKIGYEAGDPALVAALHDWFDAQLMRTWTCLPQSRPRSPGQGGNVLGDGGLGNRAAHPLPVYL